MPTWWIGSGSNDETDTAGILAHACAESFRRISRGRARNDFRRVERCRRGRQGGASPADERAGVGCFGDCAAVPRNAFRVVYAVQVGDDLWVVHAFQKKSTDGIKTPKREVDLIRDRIKRLKEILR